MLAGCLLLGGCRETVEPSKIVVVLLDTLRADALGVYGREPETAPFLSELASEAAVFEHAYSTSSWTAPSVASLFTSTYPWQHGVTLGFHAHRWQGKRLWEQKKTTIPLNRIDDGLATWAELFSQAGYPTYGLASNRNISSELAFDRGFDRFLHKYQATMAEFYLDLAGWKEELNRSRPYFLYLHFNDIHEPYEIVQPAYEIQLCCAEESEARYLSQVAYVDHWLESILTLLEWDESTLLVVLSDHGEEFGEHGGSGHGPQLYTELNRVVAILYGPGLGIRPQRIAANVSLIDILPTVLDLAGIEPPDQAQGLSLASILKLDSQRHSVVEKLRDRILLAHRLDQTRPGREITAGIQGPWKLVRENQGDLELYDHRTDPGEHQDIIDQYPREARELSHEMDRLLMAIDKPSSEQIEIPVDETLLEELEALGYVN